jgi:hypothetical protein
VEPLGVVTGRHHEGRRGVRTDAEDAEEIGHGGQEDIDALVELGQLAVERFDAMGQRGQRRLGGRGHHIGRSCRPESGSFGDEGRHREALQAASELFRRAVAEVAHLDERVDPGLAGRTLGHHEDPDGLDRTVSRLGAPARPATESGPSGFEGVEGSDLPLARRFWRFGRSTSMTSTPTLRRWRASPAP